VLNFTMPLPCRNRLPMLCSICSVAFRDTYGIDMDDILHVDDFTLETYRFSIAHVIPEMTQVALATRKQNMLREKPDLARKEFLYNLSRADYEKDFGAKYRRPGIFARILAFLLKLIPKFGPFKALLVNSCVLTNPGVLPNFQNARSHNRGLIFRMVKLQVHTTDQ
jgi:hypothetical protein